MKRRISIRESDNLPLDKALNKFINLKIAMNKSERTIEYYNQRFNSFTEFIKTHENIYLTMQITDECIINYILHMKQKNPNLSNNTVNNHLRAIRAVLYYFMDKGFTECFHISLITVKQIPKEGYSKEEQEKLLQKPDIKKCNFSQYRNWVIICHLLASGISSRTLRYIQNKHIDLKDKIITLVEVKNNQGYEMPISNEYFPILSEYMNIRGGNPDDYLFCNQYGKQITGGGLNSIINKYNKKCGVEKNKHALI